MLDTDNRELQQALQIIQYTSRSLFLTGKAGTGKSTFLRHICANTKKKHVILAPTGIAAINAGGTTLHSFFKLPFHPLLPDDERYSVRNLRATMEYTSEKRKILRKVELIVIDEISMVRADIIDFIDKVLRVFSRNMRQPFGGKQLLLVGDMFQLEPVVKEDERRMLHPYYPTTLFFGARVWRETHLVSIELQKTYRQTDAAFISILDHLRTGCATDTDLNTLNTRVTMPEESETSMAITLSTRRDTVDYINERKLKSLPGEATNFTGKITGDFPASSLPTPEQLELKPGNVVRRNLQLAAGRYGHFQLAGGFTGSGSSGSIFPIHYARVFPPRPGKPDLRRESVLGVEFSYGETAENQSFIPGGYRGLESDQESYMRFFRNAGIKLLLVGISFRSSRKPGLNRTGHFLPEKDEKRFILPLCQRRAVKFSDTGFASQHFEKGIDRPVESIDIPSRML